MDNQGAAGILYNKGIDFAGGKDAWTQDEINEMRQSIKEVKRTQIVILLVLVSVTWVTLTLVSLPWIWG